MENRGYGFFPLRIISEEGTANSAPLSILASPFRIAIRTTSTAEQCRSEAMPLMRRTKSGGKVILSCIDAGSFMPQV